MKFMKIKSIHRSLHWHWNEGNDEKGRMKNHSDGDTLITKAQRTNLVCIYIHITYIVQNTSISRHWTTTFYEIHSIARIFSIFFYIFCVLVHFLYPRWVGWLVFFLFLSCFLTLSLVILEFLCLFVFYSGISRSNSNRFLYATTKNVWWHFVPHTRSNSLQSKYEQNGRKRKTLYVHRFIHASADNNANPFYIACLKFHIYMSEIWKRA